MLGPVSPAPLPETELDLLLGLLKCICETPAPTSDEAARAKLIAELWGEAGLEPRIDAVGNVVAKLPGGVGSRVLVAARLDTVFGPDTEIKVNRQGERLLAPGIGDNSASLAVLSYYAKRLTPELPRARLTLAATVGEEGLGDLRGIRELMRQAEDFDLVIALDGHLGTVIDRAVGSKRFEVGLSAAGGHSWGDYPNPSAVHALGDMVHALTRISVPKEPRSSLNVGEVQGGTSINAIAQAARFNLDLRSLDADVLASLEAEALGRIRRLANQHRVKADIVQVGDRPVATVDNSALVSAARAALEEVGVPLRTAASSTDANAALAAGLPAISFGVYRGGDAHRLSEWLDPASLATGYAAFVQLVATLSVLDV